MIILVSKQPYIFLPRLNTLVCLNGAWSGAGLRPWRAWRLMLLKHSWWAFFRRDIFQMVTFPPDHNLAHFSIMPLLYHTEQSASWSTILTRLLSCKPFQLMQMLKIHLNIQVLSDCGSPILVRFEDCQILGVVLPPLALAPGLHRLIWPNYVHFPCNARKKDAKTLWNYLRKNTTVQLYKHYTNKKWC